MGEGYAVVGPLEEAITRAVFICQALGVEVEFYYAGWYLCIYGVGCWWEKPNDGIPGLRVENSKA